MSDAYVHAILSASAAHRWSLCTAAPAACKGVKEGRTSEHAALGTAKHAASYNALMNVAEPESALGKTVQADGFKFKVNDEFVDHVNTYVRAIQREPGDRSYEVNLPTHEVYGVPDRAGGTADCAIADFDAMELSVHDAKFGHGRVLAVERDAQGRAVPGTGNKQLLSYLAAWVQRYDPVAEFKKFRIAIHQPSINHYDEHAPTREEIDEFVAWIRPRAKQAWELYQHGTPEQIRAAMSPSEEACKWCPIRGSCAARADQVADLFDNLPQNDAGQLYSALQLDDAEIGKSLLVVEDMESYCRDVRSEARKRALEGRKIPMHKVIQDRKGNRYWKDKAKVLELLEAVLEPEQLYEPREIKSPKQLENVIGKSGMAAVKDLVGQNPGAYQLVPDTDPRKEVAVIDPMLTFPEV